jgi:recombination associated protein RdgC
MIKNAHVYRADIPTDLVALHNHLSERSFSDPLSNQTQSHGFVPPFGQGCTLVGAYLGGMAFSLRVDTKVMPASAINAEVKKRVALRLEQTGQKRLSKLERADIKDVVRSEFCAKAIVTTAVINIFYDTESRFLVVATASQRMADLVTTALVGAIGSMKTETINVSSVKLGLTTRLTEWLPRVDAEGDQLEGDMDAFGEFSPTGEVAMANAERHKLTVKADTLAAATDALIEAIKRGYGVTSIRLSHGCCAFRLTSDFHLRGIDVPREENPVGNDWEHEAAWEMTNVVAVMNDLCAMFAYKAPEGAEEGGEA